MVKKIKQFINFFLPPYCHICDKRLNENEKVLCDECFNSIHIIVPPICERCGRLSNHAVCNECIIYPHNFIKARAVGKYELPLSEMIYLFKDYHKISLGKKLGKLMSKYKLAEELINSVDAIIPVPLHSVRKRERGFNQSEILAKEVAMHYNLPIFLDVLFCQKFAKQQKSFENLDPNTQRIKRKENVKGIFKVKCKEKIENKRILLVDDVMTTGATLDECARMLKENGAKEVYAFVLAST